jgi:hypothetical protein
MGPRSHDHSGEHGENEHTHPEHDHEKHDRALATKPKASQ